ncbi:MAG: hypothetical protein U5K70_04365 [Halodesulfurarchaeum sp.]|nr:hypothetical protein [Halodesulfurarchaeum sp.]
MTVPAESIPDSSPEPGPSITLNDNMLAAIALAGLAALIYHYGGK